MKLPRPSIYSGSTLVQVRNAALRRQDERLMVEVLEGLFYSQDDAQVNGCMSPPLSSVAFPGQDQGK